MRMLTMVLATALASAALAGGAPAAAQKASAAEREGAAREVANLMARRAVMQARGDLPGRFALFATKQPDVTVVMLGRKVTGLDNIRKAYFTPPPSPPGTGSLTLHGLLSPIIEVAEDGKTAKGFWQSAGSLVFVRGGPPMGRLSSENYGVDFIKEDGQWRIWHIALFPDLNLPMPAEMVAGFAAPAGSSAPPPPRPNDPNAAADPYPEWTPARPMPSYPLPVPYRTFSETFSYADLGVK